MEKLKNSRIVPTSENIVQDRSFSMETWFKFQIESNRTDPDKHRYIKLESINFTQWSRDLGVNVKTLKKNIELLIKIGVLKKYTAEDGLLYYKIQGEFDRYLLFEERFVRKLLNIGSKNLIKVYLIYCKYTIITKEKCCRLDQGSILQGIGLSANSKNKAMLKDINDTLCDLGLIWIKKDTIHENGKTKTLLFIKTPDYYCTKFYKDAIA